MSDKHQETFWRVRGNLIEAPRRLIQSARFEAAGFAAFERVSWPNPRRLLEPIGTMPPAEAGLRNDAWIAKPALAAALNGTGFRQTRYGTSRALPGNSQTCIHGVFKARLQPFGTQFAQLDLPQFLSCAGLCGDPEDVLGGDDRDGAID